MNTNNKNKLIALIKKMLAGEASIEDIRRLFNFFQSHQQITTWQNHFEPKERVEEKIFDNIQKKANIGAHKKPKMFQLFQKNLVKYAAVLLLGGFVTYIYFYTKLPIQGDDVKVVTNTIQAGSDKATLTLENGTTVPLEKGSFYKAQNVQSNGEEIIYDITNESDVAIEVVYNYLTIPRGGQFFVQLSDGTKVWLNSESQLKYPKSFIAGKPRTVELVYGEAYFEVSPSSANKGMSFMVTSEGQWIEVLGTEFNVKAYRDENQIYTTLVEGAIALSYYGERVLLKPDERAVLNDQTKTLEIHVVDVYNEVSWKDGVFSFRKKPLKEVMKVLSRWYDIDVVFENKQLENKTFKGVLVKNQKLEDILSILKSASTLKAYEINDKTIILK